MDLDDLGDEAPAWSTFEVHDDIYGISDICLNRVGAIYRTHWTNLFAFYGLHLSDFERDQAMFAPQKTQLAPDSPEAEETIVIPLQSQEALRLD